MELCWLGIDHIELLLQFIRWKVIIIYNSPNILIKASKDNLQSDIFSGGNSFSGLSEFEFEYERPPVG